VQGDQPLKQIIQAEFLAKVVFAVQKFQMMKGFSLRIAISLAFFNTLLLQQPFRL